MKMRLLALITVGSIIIMNAGTGEASSNFTCGHTSIDPLGTRSIPHRIVGGKNCTRGSVPWIVSIRQGYARKKHICGGTILYVGNTNESDMIVTAAHCVYNEFDPDGIDIVAGDHDLKLKEQDEQIAEFEEYVLHPNYNHTTKESDIALVKLATPFKFGQNVQPVCLPATGQMVVDGAMGLVAGWGRLKDGDRLPPSQFLQELTMPIVNPEKCQEMYKKFAKPKNINKATMICAGYPTDGGKDSCQGDSGGPLLFRQGRHTYVLQGVVSFGEGCAQKNTAGVYARVSAFVPWINDNIKLWSTSAKKT